MTWQMGGLLGSEPHVVIEKEKEIGGFFFQLGLVLLISAFTQSFGFG